MSRESEVADLLRADDPLMAILLGGIYTDQEIGVEGFRRGANSPTKDAFDEDGFLRPCALVKQRALVPFGGLHDEAEKIDSASQAVEIYFYEDRGHTALDLAKERVYSLLAGYRFSAAYPARWALETGPIPDVGPLKGNTTLRQDWQIVSLRRG